MTRAPAGARRPGRSRRPEAPASFRAALCPPPGRSPPPQGACFVQGQGRRRGRCPPGAGSVAPGRSRPLGIYPPPWAFFFSRSNDFQGSNRHLERLCLCGTKIPRPLGGPASPWGPVPRGPVEASLDDRWGRPASPRGPMPRGPVERRCPGSPAAGSNLRPVFSAASSCQLGEDQRVLDQPLANVVAGFAEGFRRIGEPLSLARLAALATAAGPAMEAVTLGNIIAAAQRLPPPPPAGELDQADGAVAVATPPGKG